MTTNLDENRPLACSLQPKPQSGPRTVLSPIELIGRQNDDDHEAPQVDEGPASPHRQSLGDSMKPSRAAWSRTSTGPPSRCQSAIRGGVSTHWYVDMVRVTSTEIVFASLSEAWCCHPSSQCVWVGSMPLTSVIFRPMASDVNGSRPLRNSPVFTTCALEAVSATPIVLAGRFINRRRLSREGQRRFGVLLQI